MTRFRFAVAASALPLLFANHVYASGFALNEMSAAGVGNAHAGGAAAAEDLGTLYFNPAGLTRMSGRQFMAVGSAIRPGAEFNNQGTRSALGTPMAGGNGGDAGSWALVPALFTRWMSRPICALESACSPLSV